MYKKLIFIAVVLFAMGACKKSFDPGATKAVKVANEWWVDIYLNGQDLLGTFVKLSTYNVAANNDSIWVDDFGNIDNFKCRAQFNKDSLTFQTTNAVNDYFKITVPPDTITPPKITIIGAKVMPSIAKSKTGVKTDSIYFKIKFSNDPNTYEIKGSARTGWAEDDY